MKMALERQDSSMVEDEVLVRRQVEGERQRLWREAGLQDESRPHFRRPVERPFTAEEREVVTVLYGGFTLRHDTLIGAALNGMGYRAQRIDTATKADFQAGKEYGNNGQCNPTYFTVGALVNYLKHLRDEQGLATADILKNYVFATAGSCGPCRFGMYEAEYRLALRNSGFDGFRVILFQQTGGLGQSQNSGLIVNAEFALALINGIMIGDVLNELAYQIRPYEVEPGATDRVFEEVARRVGQAMTARHATLRRAARSRLRARFALRLWRDDSLYLILDQLLSSYYTDVLRDCAALINTIAVDYTRAKPICKITGEFWAQTTEGDGNFNMFPFLERQGAEVLVEPVTTWLMYLLAQEHSRVRDEHAARAMRRSKWDVWGRLSSSARTRFRRARLTLVTKLLNREYNRIRMALGGTTHAQLDQLEMQRIAHPYYNSKSAGGEGHLEVAKNIYYSNKSLAHMVLSLKPFGCMPSTQSDGAQAAVLGHFPDMIYIPIETSGEGDINAHSRAQMALGEAKAKCKLEFRQCLERTGRSLDAIRMYCSAHPELQRPLQAIPHRQGIVGKAASFVLYVEGHMREHGAPAPAPAGAEAGAR
jgi:predicted nucleotide-binding protein (sugar kinase/HSP70/actin superfamily)